jgi:hypothetical protein
MHDEPELQLVEIEKKEEKPHYTYQELNEKCDMILEKFRLIRSNRERKS